MVAKHGTIYAVSDGNHYTTELQAKERCKEALKLREIKRYAKIDASNCPVNECQLEKMWITVEQISEAAPKPAPRTYAFDMAAAEEAFRKKMEESQKQVDATQDESPKDAEVTGKQGRRKTKD